MYEHVEERRHPFTDDPNKRSHSAESILTTVLVQLKFTQMLLPSRQSPQKPHSGTLVCFDFAQTISQVPAWSCSCSWVVVVLDSTLVGSWHWRAYVHYSCVGCWMAGIHNPVAFLEDSTNMVWVCCIVPIYHCGHSSNMFSYQPSVFLVNVRSGQHWICMFTMLWVSCFCLPYCICVVKVAFFVMDLKLCSILCS